MKKNRLLLFIVLVSGTLAASIKSGQTKQIMHSVYASMDTILPLSIRLGDFSDKKNIPIIKKELANLKKNAFLLNKHVATTTINNKIVSDNLAADIMDLEEIYNNGEYERSRFILHNLTENCTNCHTRMNPSQKKDTSFQIHFSKENMKDLNGFDLAHFQAMVRQFDLAMDTYEKEFRKEPMQIDSQSFYEYLKIAIRVKSDYDRVLNLLKDLHSKIDKKLDLYQTVNAWIQSLRDIKRNKLDANVSMKTTEQLLTKAGAIITYPKDESGFIYLLTASKNLHTMLDSNKFSKDELAKIYFYLGQTEGFISLSCWLNEYEQYYEYAIRTSPGSTWAELALSALQESYLFGFSGSSGTHLPPEIIKKLQELNELILKTKIHERKPIYLTR